MSRAALAIAMSVALVLAGLCSARLAFADVDLELRLGAREVAVGESFQVQLDAMSSDGTSPSDPEIVLPPSFEVRGPSVGTRQQVSISGFNMVTQRGISASWVLTPTRPGVYSIGPGSVSVGGQRQEARAVQVRVLPEGQRPRGRARRQPPLDPFDSLDPFSGSGAFDDLFDRLRGGSRFEQLPEAPAELVPARPLDSLAFLTTHLDTERAVVGQQVTLSIYAHGAQGLFQEAPGAREPTHPDFLAQRLVEDGSRQPIYQYSLDGERWIAVKVREIALFPLRAGRLEVGPLDFGFLGRRYGVRQGEGLRRTSRSVFIEVSEPPAAGRPPGFSGDVGQFDLTATVEPRNVPAGGSIAVTARLVGTGRLPGALQTPEQSGVAWLAPTLRDEVNVTGSTVGGTRTFSYLVRLERPGEIELGTLRVSFYNPQRGRYETARVELGKVHVGAAPPADPGAPPAEATAGPRLSDLVSFRDQLDGPRAPMYWADRGAFWWLLGLGPALVAALAAALALSQRVRRGLERRESSRATHAQRALSEGREALAAGELGKVASAEERALYTAIEHATGLKVRAVLRADLERTLGAAGLPSELCRRATGLLERAGQLRLAGADTALAQSLAADVEALVKVLLQRPPARTSELPDAGEAVRS